MTRIVRGQFLSAAVAKYIRDFMDHENWSQWNLRIVVSRMLEIPKDRSQTISAQRLTSYRGPDTRAFEIYPRKSSKNDHVSLNVSPSTILRAARFYQIEYENTLAYEMTGKELLIYP